MSLAAAARWAELGTLFVCLLWTVWLLVFRPSRRSAASLSKRARWGQLGDGDADLAIERWLPGRWYEVAKWTSGAFAFQNNTCNSLDFSPVGNGVSMDMVASCYENSFIFPERARRFNSGTCDFVGTNSVRWSLDVMNGMLTVQVVVVIRHVDHVHGFCLLSPQGKMDRSVYLVSRRPQLSEEGLKTALRVVKELGFDLRRLKPSSQQNPYEDVHMLSTVRRYGVLSMRQASQSQPQQPTPSLGAGAGAGGVRPYAEEDKLSPFVFREAYSQLARRERVVAKFFEGCVRGDLTYLYDFIQREPLWVDARDGDGWVCLHYAALNGYKDLAHYMLVNGANINSRTQALETPLMMSVRGLAQHARLLLRMHADPSASVFSARAEAATIGSPVSAPAPAPLPWLPVLPPTLAAPPAASKFSLKPHSLPAMRKTMKMLLDFGAKPYMRGGRHDETALQLLEREITRSPELAACLGATAAAPAHADDPAGLRAEVGAALEDVRAMLAPGGMLAKEGERKVQSYFLRATFFLAACAFYGSRNLWRGVGSAFRALMLGLRIVAVYVTFWLLLRPLGYAWLVLAPRWPSTSTSTSNSGSTSSSRSRQLAFGEYRAELVLRMVYAINNPTVLKVAQILSSRPDIVDKAVAGKLEVLRQHVPPMTARELEEELSWAYGVRREHIFETFDPVPLASGTIAQVHRARLANGGGEVAVKVVRHSIVLGLERVLRLVNLVLRPTRNRTLKERTQRIYSLVLCQTDMMLEAASINAMQRACDAALKSGVDSVRVPRIPRVHSITTCRSVLTMELVQGLLPFDRWRDAGVPGDLLGMRLAHYFLRSLLVDGIFHCDLHPGNIMIDPAEHGRFTLLDFGLVGELDETDRVNLCAFFLAALTGENAVAVDVFTKAFVTNADAVLHTHELRARFASEAEPCFAAHFVTADEFDIHAAMRDFERLFSRYKLLYTGVWAVVELGMLTLQGTLALLLGKSGGVKERMRQFVTANYKVMLRSLAGTTYFERLNDRVLAKFNWGAILARQAR